MFYDANAFPFVRTLEENWQTIRAEYAGLAATEFVDWPETDLYNAGWTVFGFSFFGDGNPQSEARCPHTAAILRSIPGLVSAGISVMAPRTHIKPHTGYTSEVVRCHLGIVVSEHCAIRVGNDIRAWIEGKCLIFDDTVEHEAWNRSDLPRAVLLIDVERKTYPGLQYPHASDAACDVLSQFPRDRSPESAGEEHKA